MSVSFNHRDNRNENFVLTMAILIMLVAMTFYANVIATDAEAQTVTGSAAATAKVKCGQAGTTGINVNCDNSANTGANVINGDTVNSPNTAAGANAGSNVTNGATLGHTTAGTNANVGATVNTANPGAGSVGAAGGLGGGAHLR